jgi:SseB protein N-terminal domain/SseB protein C-terminal domain
MTVVTDDNTATPAPASPPPEDAVERALDAAVADPARVGDLLDELRVARLWVPLPDDGRAVTDGSAVNLPTVTYLGSEFVPAFTSARRLAAASTTGASTDDPVGPPTPHMVVRTADLAGLLPAPLGIALNPGAGASVPVYPEGVAYLAAAPNADPGGRITVSAPATQPDALLAAIRAGLIHIPAASEAAAAWLSVEFAGEGLIISVTLDDPADTEVQAAVIRTLEQAVQQAPQDAGFPIDVTFPGEGEPDPIDEWISAFATPFYQRG